MHFPFPFESFSLSLSRRVWFFLNIRNEGFNNLILLNSDETLLTQKKLKCCLMHVEIFFRFFPAVVYVEVSKSENILQEKPSFGNLQPN